MTDLITRWYTFLGYRVQNPRLLAICALINALCAHDVLSRRGEGDNRAALALQWGAGLVAWAGCLRVGSWKRLGASALAGVLVTGVAGVVGLSGVVGARQARAEQ